MKKFSAILLACAMVFSLGAPQASAASIDTSVIVAPQYDDARAFSSGLAAVRRGDKWGYISETGATVIPFNYDVACSFSENRAVVGVKKSITIDGNSLTIIEFGSIDMQNTYRPFALNYVPAGEHPNFYVEIFNAEGEVLDHSDIFFTGGYVLISDEVGRNRAFRPDGSELVIATDKLDAYPAFKPTDGVVIATEADGDGTSFFMDTNGKLLPELNALKIDYARPFNQGLSPVCRWVETGMEDGFPVGEPRWGFADKSGKIVIDFLYDDFYVNGYDAEYKVFGDGGLACVKKPGAGYGAIDMTGREVIAFKYDILFPFNEGLAAFKSGAKWGFVDTEGREVIPAKYDDVAGFNEGVAVCRIGDKPYILGRDGKQVAGADTLNISAYFVEDGTNEDGSPHYIIHAPSSIVAIVENKKCGFARVNFTPDLPSEPDVNDWAVAEVTKAAQQNLLPVALQNSYRANITRGDFATLIVRTIEQAEGRGISAILKEKTGKTLYEQIAMYPFSDTNAADIIAARALGIINGVTATQYAPQNSISRQDAASLLMRTANFLGKTQGGEKINFADEAQFADYAKEAIAFTSSLKIMNGTGENKFSPKDYYTRQQAYITSYRLLEAVSK